MKSGDKGEYQIYYRAMLCLILMLTFFIFENIRLVRCFIYTADKFHLRNPQFADIDLVTPCDAAREVWELCAKWRDAYPRSDYAFTLRNERRIVYE